MLIFFVNGRNLYSVFTPIPEGKKKKKEKNKERKRVMGVTEKSFCIKHYNVKELDIPSVCNTALSNVVMNDFSVLQHFSSVELFLIILRK